MTDPTILSNGRILGVVTVTFNAKEYLDPFLQCCLLQRGVDFSLLIIDNASSDGTRELLTRLTEPRVQVTANAANIGYSAACNQAVRHFADQGVQNILFINNDTEFGPDLFKSLLDELITSKADALTPRISYFEHPTRNWYSGGSFQFWKGFQGSHSRLAPSRLSAQWVDVAPGCCVLIPIRTFRRIGLFDPTYFVYFEDTDFFWRMKKAGLRLRYLASAVVAHKVSMSTGGPQSDFSIRFHQRNQAYALKKHFHPVFVAVQVVVIVAKATMRLILRRDTARQYRLRVSSIVEGISLPIREEDRIPS